MSEARPVGTGFTLVEILVVLILMGLAAALVAPALIAPRREPDLKALLGSCAFDVRSGAAAQVVALDQLTCEIRAP